MKSFVEQHPQWTLVDAYSFKAVQLQCDYGPGKQGTSYEASFIQWWLWNQPAGPSTCSEHEMTEQWWSEFGNQLEYPFKLLEMMLATFSSGFHA